MGIGSILGGIAGLLIPGGGALFSSIGSGLGSLLIDKESPKDAIKSALLAGAGAKLFGTGITSSAMGQSAQKGLARLGVGTSTGIENVLGAAAAPTAAAAVRRSMAVAIRRLASLSAATGAVTPEAFRMKMLAMLFFSLSLVGCDWEHISLSLL